MTEQEKDKYDITERVKSTYTSKNVVLTRWYIIRSGDTSLYT